jgi:hypothetical protein
MSETRLRLQNSQKSELGSATQQPTARRAIVSGLSIQQLDRKLGT